MNSKRVATFAKYVVRSRKDIFRSPVNWHNLRACWFQSDPDWFNKLQPVFESNEEAEEFIRAIED